MTDEYEQTLYHEDVSEGDTAPEVHIEEVTRADIVKYAGASGDFNRLHIDEPFAKAKGNESVVAHGMLTGGYVTHMISDWFGIQHIEQFRIRFQNRVMPGDSLTVTGTITDVTESTVEADIVVKNQNGTDVISGDVSAQLPKRTA